MVSSILLDVADEIATVTINRPEHNNSFTFEMADMWADTLEECRDRADVSVIVLTGAGNVFCAGGDLAMLGRNKTVTPLEVKAQFHEGLHRIARLMTLIDKPTIAAVNGRASGAGLDMALHCDLRFAADTAFFTASYTRFGLFPGNGGTWFLPRVVGSAKALELFWEAEPVPAPEALRIGLVNRVYAAPTLMQETIAFARKVISRAPIPVRLIKRAIYQQQDMDLNASLDMTSSHMSFTRTSYDHGEAVAAFFENREPMFEGR